RVFDAASNLLLRALRIEPVHDVEHSATVRDLEHIVEESRDSGDLPAELSVLLDRIIDFPRRDVEHAMIPRAHVDVVDATETLAEVRARMATGHSRYPVLTDDEQVVGVVHLDDVLAGAEGDETPASGFMRSPLVLAASMTLPDALRELTRSRNRMACVIDEYGGFAGVLTLEDLAEELVGEITDEHDPATPTLAPVADDGIWVMAGDVHIDEVERAVGRDLPRDGYETIAGLVIAHRGSLPEAGDVVHVELPPDPADLAHADEPAPVWMRVDVLELERRVPALVRVTVPAEPPAPTDAHAEETGR
ncbi:hemolysin family protein, partial [Cellulomonas sp. 179-A 4D5 NHS]|uniref:hemolysin family protein n=1 Tax=Cellulomonas sp. 179-A 4D5 NHS TaxID=3142378 RepID=UPI0039A2B815